MTTPATLSNFAINIIAQASAPEGGNPGSPANNIWSWMPFVLMIAAFYFLLIAPQRKKQKDHQRLLSELDSGDQVLLASGFYGEITNKKEDRFVVRIADGVKVEVAKNFVQAVVRKKNAPDADKK